jgi:hypothetical protein
MKLFSMSGGVKNTFILKIGLCRVLFKIWILFILFFSGGCITQFLPETTEDQNILVVEGLITDQPGSGTIKISTSMPLGGISANRPLSGCGVTLSDDLGNFFTLNESAPGSYVPNSSFHGAVGRTYILHIRRSSAQNTLSYQSAPMLMRPVPGIDSLYYERVILSRASDGYPTSEGCQIYLNTHDPDKLCRFYRWEFAETWEFRLPYQVANKTCWVTSYSDKINIKTTSSFSDDIIEHQPLNYITNESDRLKIKYSILVNQYSLGEDEYLYWEKLQNTVEQVGSLYDMTPSSIPSNIKCIEKPAESVLGYFSVSSVKSRRIFIKDQFRGMPDLYNDCENIVVPYFDPIPSLNLTTWLIIDHPEPPPGYKVLTVHKGCADCTVRGTTLEPDFWNDAR